MKTKITDQVQIDLRNKNDKIKSIYIDVFDNHLAKKWLSALNHLLSHDYHLEKNYCFFGFPQGKRNGEFIIDSINKSISAINNANIGYQINDVFTMSTCLQSGPVGQGLPGRKIIHEKFNQLHRYFEDLQGQSQNISPYFLKADATTKWHIRQLNLLCHEFESWALSYRKEIEAPEWVRPSQLMCWMRAPKFFLDEQDLELFGVETLNRSLGGVFLGVNKSVGKHHWEVFNDEGRDSRIDELTTSALITQTEGCGDFDIEWANNPGNYHWQQKKISEFRQWLTINEFDPDDKSLTIGHPQVGQVDLQRSFGSCDYRDIWQNLNNYHDVYRVSTAQSNKTYDYRWSDADFIDRQIRILEEDN